MADQSAIEWTDSTFNPWIGCTKISPACDHCYAETQQVRCCGNSVCPPLARAIVAANVGALVEMEQREKAA